MSEGVLKNYWFWVIVILVAGIFFFYVRFDLPARQIGTSPGQATARLSVFFDDGKVRAFEGPVVKNMTLLEAVYFVSQENGLDFRYVVDKSGAVKVLSFNKDIDGEGKSWRFYLNSQPVATSDIGNIKIKISDQIEAKYE